MMTADRLNSAQVSIGREDQDSAAKVFKIVANGNPARGEIKRLSVASLQSGQDMRFSHMAPFPEKKPIPLAGESGDQELGAFAT